MHHTSTSQDASTQNLRGTAMWSSNPLHYELQPRCPSRVLTTATAAASCRSDTFREIFRIGAICIIEGSFQQRRRVPCAPRTARRRPGPGPKVSTTKSPNMDIAHGTSAGGNRQRYNLRRATTPDVGRSRSFDAELGKMPLFPTGKQHLICRETSPLPRLRTFVNI